MAMQMLTLHWKSVRLGLIPFVVAAFGLPLLSVQAVGAMGGAAEPLRIVHAAELWLPLFPALAAGLGITLALSAWNWDHQQDHVYALSLPLKRWEYALLKMGAGVVLALLPTGAFLVGAMIASGSVELPTGLHAYPMALTVRFMFATLLAYTVMFALASGTIRTAILVLSVVFLGPLVADLLVGLAANLYPELDLAGVSVVQIFVDAVTEAPGPFRIFTGNWMLIDV